MNGHRCKIELKPSGLLLISLLSFFLDLGVLISVIGNIVVHEWGHIFALKKCGVYIRKITIGFTGLCIACNLDYLSPYKRLLCCASGPIFGLCAALIASFLGNICGWDSLLLFSGTGLILSLFNLLPIKPLDGWQMMQAVAPMCSSYISCICSFVVLVFGLYVMFRGYGTGLAFLGVFFLMQR